MWKYFQPFTLRFSWWSILKKNFSINFFFFAVLGIFQSSLKVPWMPWPETDNVTDLPVPIFFSKVATNTDLYAALHTLLNFSSGSALTHAFQMVLKKASLWLWCTLLLAYSRSHYAVTFRKKLRQEACFCFQLWSSVSVRQWNHNLQVQNNSLYINNFLLGERTACFNYFWLTVVIIFPWQTFSLEIWDPNLLLSHTPILQFLPI